MKTKQLKWTTKPSPENNKAIFFAESSTGAWDGNETGHEWTIGFAIHFADPGGPYELFYDDGKGNGKHISTHVKLMNALEAAEKEDERISV